MDLSGKKLLTLADLDAMVRAGILAADDRVELLAGEVVKMPPIGPPQRRRCQSQVSRRCQTLHQSPDKTETPGRRAREPAGDTTNQAAGVSAAPPPARASGASGDSAAGGASGRLPGFSGLPPARHCGHSPGR
jgi:hypothetical protein